MTGSYDAVLIVSFGGPEAMDDVMPFLENVTRGKNVPKERLAQVAEHYKLFGGKSPINDQNRRIVDSLKKELETQGPNLPVYWGNRNWQPYLADTLAKMRDDGIRNAIAFITSAYSSYSSCRQYLDDISRAREAVGASAPNVQKIRAFYNHPLFLEANVENIQAAISACSTEQIEKMSVAFTAHSIPLSMSSGCGYETQLQEICGLVAAAANLRHWKLVYQSRSGPPQVPWLEPDILDHIRQLKKDGVSELLIHPVGFVSDHMEVVYDLDHEAKALCDQLGIHMRRSATASNNTKFIEMVRQLILELVDPALGRPVVGDLGAVADVCPADCCPPGSSRPAISHAAKENL